VQGFVRNLCDVVNTLLRLGGGPYATALRNVNRECGNKGAYVQLVVFLIPVVHRVSPC